MLSKEFLGYISHCIHSEIESHQSVSGGDISAAYLLETKRNKYFLKVNSKPWALDMFMAEAVGLRAISNTKTISTPKVIATDNYLNEAFLLMEYVDTKSSNSNNMELFGMQLAQLHQMTSDTFGFDHNNFIGSLDQSNYKHKFWNDFYIEERLLPQLSLSLSKGLLSNSEIPETEFMKTCCSPYFKYVRPSLLHGDLWSGNYLISSDGNPYLIKSGDTLGKISNTTYGTIKYWKNIWNNNKPLIKDPNKIFAGFTIYTPLIEGRDVANDTRIKPIVNSFKFKK